IAPLILTRPHSCPLPEAEGGSRAAVRPVWRTGRSCTTDPAHLPTAGVHGVGRRQAVRIEDAVSKPLLRRGLSSARRGRTVVTDALAAAGAGGFSAASVWRRLLRTMDTSTKSTTPSWLKS